jgi:hypothetical protein
VQVNTLNPSSLQSRDDALIQYFILYMCYPSSHQTEVILIYTGSSKLSSGLKARARGIAPLHTDLKSRKRGLQRRLVARLRRGRLADHRGHRHQGPRVRRARSVDMARTAKTRTSGKWMRVIITGEVQVVLPRRATTAACSADPEQLVDVGWHLCALNDVDHPDRGAG